MPGTVTFPATVVLMLWCALSALTADARATPLDRAEFESASERRVPGGALSPGDRIQGDLAKPDGAGPFPAVIVLHGCAGMHDTTKQKLVDDLVAWGYVTLLVDSYATRRIDHACEVGALATLFKRRPDAYGIAPTVAARVKVFGCRPHGGGAARTGGRRPQTSKGGNRGRPGEVGRQTLWGFESRG